MNGTASTTDDVISVGQPLPRMAAVQVSDGRRVHVTWRNGRSVLVDLAPVFLSHRHFIPLRNNDELFQTVRVNDDGVALEWDGGIELTAEWIERLPVAGMDNAEFRQVMSALDLTLDGMAAQLEVSRRLVAQFRGSKPIPNYIALAVRYLAEHGSAPAAPEPNNNYTEARLSA
ncbi:Protein of unknown function [Mesorhizobium albiziae]|uniref:DUF2442 domain-containing protein n=1 Tax=Neomesorhizobium albiziae TaxID=335020 RepID=A0A1I3YXF1_9HYPH|nr:DUF2442 domain-containing protein [Mesorhizobium albiziae]GLS33252.1 hypothetical protein GCM10007937_49630 [Mesorhizobium albiziae]SFK35891.1 Protein of unknown function [Mesorhizobium albiziae]